MTVAALHPELPESSPPDGLAGGELVALGMRAPGGVVRPSRLGELVSAELIRRDPPPPTGAAGAPAPTPT